MQKKTQNGIKYQIRKKFVRCEAFTKRKFVVSKETVGEKYSKYYSALFVDDVPFSFDSIVLQRFDSSVGVRVVNAALHAELAIDDRVQEVGGGNKERYQGGLEGYDGVRGKDKEEAREPDVSPPPTRKG